MIYVTSDFHFNDDHIIECERTQFATIEEHNKYIVDRYNSIVKDEDTVYILGDIGFGEFNKYKKYLKKLKGHKILIKGNHDWITEREAYEVGFEGFYDHPIYFNDHIILSHEPAREAYLNPYIINVHGHLHHNPISLKNYYNVNIGDNKYSLIPMDLFIRLSHSCKDREEHFTHEWYFEFYSDKKIH